MALWTTVGSHVAGVAKTVNRHSPKASLPHPPRQVGDLSHGGFLLYSLSQHSIPFQRKKRWPTVCIGLEAKIAYVMIGIARHGRSDKMLVTGG